MVVRVSRQRGRRLLSVHAGSQRRIVKMVERLHGMPPKAWFAVYGAPLAREVRRREDARQALARYTTAREEWRRNVTLS